MKYVSKYVILQLIRFFQAEGIDLPDTQFHSKRKESIMKEYEIVAKFCNACAGSSRPQTFFEEAELNSPEDYVKMKHGRDFEQFTKEILPSGQIVFQYDNGSVSYNYEFTEI